MYWTNIRKNLDEKRGKKWRKGRKEITNVKE